MVLVFSCELYAIFQIRFAEKSERLLLKRVRQSISNYFHMKVLKHKATQKIVLHDLSLIFERAKIKSRNIKNIAIL